MQSEYQPKGGMCAGCTHKAADCSGMEFKSMPVIGRWDGVLIVRCVAYESDRGDKS